MKVINGGDVPPDQPDPGEDYDFAQWEENERELRRRKAIRNADEREAAERDAERDGGLWTDGASFIFDAPARPEALWGDTGSGVVLWQPGEAAAVTGPQGVAKSTLAQQLMFRRIGVIGSPLLGYGVLPLAEGTRCAYLAMDRPSQVQRSMARMVTEDHKDVLSERLFVWKGPLPPGVGLHPHPASIAGWLADNGVNGDVYVDSYKDIAFDLTNSEAGSRLNSAVQHALVKGIQWFGINHNRKAQQGNSKPKNLDDSFGSVWITAGHGSILGLWARPGAKRVQLDHLKQPAEPCPALTFELDREHGTVTIPGDAMEMALAAIHLAGDEGVTEKVLAKMIWGDDGKAECHKVERALGAAEYQDQVERITGKGGRGSTPSVWRVLRK